jgi:lipopolysaccharide transport system permease protein
VARVRELWEYRALIAYFGRRLLEKRYTRTWLGIVWIPLRPGLDVALRVLLFGGLLGVSSGGVPYFVFFAVGMAAWMVLESAAYWATRSLEINRSILRRIYVPRTAVLVSAVIPAGVDFVLYLLIAVVGATALWLAGGTFDLDLVPGEHMLVAGGGLCLLLLFGLAIGLWTSVFGATARDVRLGFNYVMQLWFFITPVIYPVSAIPANFRPIAMYNPATAPVEAVKYGLLDTAPPQTSSLVVTLATLAVLLVSGMWWFGRCERAGIEHV